jgi:chemosensory pili system protein ChpA (sensor histidine kinase/response regulator)
MVRSGELKAAIEVEGLIGSREIVVKPVGPQLSTLRGISGATIMGDGRVVLILDLGVLIRLANAQREETGEERRVIEEVVEARKPVVMVVDDSITVRKVTTRLLERNEMETLSAKDGVDALAQLQEVRPDVMLLDVEMPRMDGFELATNIRNDENLKDIPIIMITSRTGEKHRERALGIGVNVYMGKPYNENELLENIHTLIAQ